MKKIALVIFTVVSLVLGMSLASAVEPGNASITNTVDLGSYTFTSADTLTTQSGNISYTNLTTNQSTYRWAGILGTVTGEIVLGDSSNAALFTWTGAGLMVYASEGAVAWSTLEDATVTNVTGVAAYLGGDDSDNYTNTFVGGSENIGSGIYTGISSDFATTQSSGATTWKTYSLWDTTNLVWAGLVSEDGTGFDGTTVDYQMIVPEDGEGDDQTTTSYNLWVELQ